MLCGTDLLTLVLSSTEPCWLVKKNQTNTWTLLSLQNNTSEILRQFFKSELVSCKVAERISPPGNKRKHKRHKRGAYRTPHWPSWAVRASIRSCFLVPVVGIPNCLQASFNTGTVSFPRVPFCMWARSSPSDISTFGFFSAPPPLSAAV